MGAAPAYSYYPERAPERAPRERISVVPGRGTRTQTPTLPSSVVFLAKVAAVVLLVFIVTENLQPGSTVQNLLMKVLRVLVAVSVLYSALLCFVPETGWYSDIYPWAYQDVIETAQFWT